MDISSLTSSSAAPSSINNEKDMSNEKKAQETQDKEKEIKTSNFEKIESTTNPPPGYQANGKVNTPPQTETEKKEFFA